MASVLFDVIVWQEHEHIFMWTIRSCGEIQREGYEMTMDGAKATAYSSLRELMVDA